MRTHVQGDLRSNFTGKASCPKISDDEGIDIRITQGSQICWKRLDIAVVHDDVERHVHLDVMSMSVANCRRNLVEGEVARPLPHAKAIAGQVDSIGAEAHRILQLLESTRRRKKFHGYLPFP